MAKTDNWKKEDVAIYTRSSQPRQGEAAETTAAQIEEMTEWAEKLKKQGKIKSYQIYDEGVYSGAEEDRPQRAALIANVNAGKHGRIGVLSLERWSRDQYDWFHKFQPLRLQGVTLYSKDRDVITGLKDDIEERTDEIVIGVLIPVAQEERAGDIRKTLRGVKTALRRGTAQSGQAIDLERYDWRDMWGQMQINGTRRIDPETGKQYLKDSGKLAAYWNRDRKFINRYYRRFLLMGDELERWLDWIEILARFQKENKGKKGRKRFVKVRKFTSGYTNYPTGVITKGDRESIIIFPYPLDFNLKALGETDNPESTFPDWEIERLPAPRNPTPLQLQGDITARRFFD